MALTLEDGSGVPEATSFVDLTYANAFHAARGNTGWTGADAAKDAAMTRAFDYLCNEQRFLYRGTRTTSTQRAPFPRTDCQERNGPLYAPTQIPWRIKDAQCLLALVALTRPLESALARGGRVVSETIGPISTSYAADAPVETVYTGVVGLLFPILTEADWNDILPYLTDATVESEYVRGYFDNTGSV